MLSSCICISFMHFLFMVSNKHNVVQTVDSAIKSPSSGFGMIYYAQSPLAIWPSHKPPGQPQKASMICSQAFSCVSHRLHVNCNGLMTGSLNCVEIAALVPNADKILFDEITYRSILHHPPLKSSCFQF